MIRTLLFLICLAAVSGAQTDSKIGFTYGVKLGAPINTLGTSRFAFPNTTTQQGRWTGGPAPYDVRVTQQGRAWEFSLLGKYRFVVGPARPFVSAGYQWTRESTDSTTTYQCLAGAAGCGGGDGVPHTVCDDFAGVPLFTAGDGFAKGQPVHWAGGIYIWRQAVG
jgi:hypothetical protein